MAQELGMDDLIKRLDRTVCMYKGMPVYVNVDTRKEGGDNLLIHFLKKVPALVPYQRYINHREDEFVINSPPLGFMLFKQNAYFLSRKPDRQQKQGLTVGSISCQPKIGDNAWFTGKPFANCILGVHKPLVTALRLIQEDGYEGCPFERTLALRLVDGRKIGLYLRTRLIAVYNYGVSKTTFNLLPSKDQSFIKKALESTAIKHDFIILQ